MAVVADALARSQLLMRSLLGPNPILGARFYGVGNELKSGLAVLVLCAVAAALYPRAGGRPPSWRRAAGAVAFAGALLAAIEGWARIGAAVGGVVLVCVASAIAAAMLLPGPLTRRRALVVLLSPLVGLALLAALDLATAHGSGHYTGSILHARSAGDLRDVLERREELGVVRGVRPIARFGFGGRRHGTNPRGCVSRATRGGRKRDAGVP